MKADRLQQPRARVQCRLSLPVPSPPLQPATRPAQPRQAAGSTRRPSVPRRAVRPLMLLPARRPEHQLAEKPQPLPQQQSPARLALLHWALRLRSLALRWQKKRKERVRGAESGQIASAVLLSAEMLGNAPAPQPVTFSGLVSPQTLLMSELWPKSQSVLLTPTDVSGFAAPDHIPASFDTVSNGRFRAAARPRTYALDSAPARAGSCPPRFRSDCAHRRSP